MKVKSSIILAMAIEKIKSGETKYGCAAITFSMNDLQDQHGSYTVTKAQMHFNKMCPPKVRKEMMLNAEWWPVGAPERLEALEAARQLALKAND